MVVELGAAVGRSRRLVRLNDDKQPLDEVLAFLDQVVLIEPDAQVVAVVDDLEVDDLTLLVLVDPLGEDVGALRVSLAPFLRLGVVELQPKNTLAHLVHDVAPEHSFNLVVLEAEQGIDLG